MKKAAAVLALVLLLSAGSYADMRSYVWTYEYKVAEEGGVEVENYTTLSSSVAGTATEHQVEVEAGIFKNTDLAFYQKFTQSPGEGIKYSNFKIRARHLIAEKNAFFVDIGTYLEYAGVPDFSTHKIEFLKIFARDFGNFNFAFNTGFELEKAAEWEFEYAYALGLSCAVFDFLRLGLEFKGSLHEHYYGPVISFGREEIWGALSAAIRYSAGGADAKDYQVRLLLGIGVM